MLMVARGVGKARRWLEWLGALVEYFQVLAVFKQTIAPLSGHFMDDAWPIQDPHTGDAALNDKLVRSITD